MKSYWMNISNGQGQMELREVGVPVPGAGQVLVKLQQGRIGVHSNGLQQGALFWFELPLQATQAPADAAAAAVEGAEGRQPLRFLLVDDNAVNLMVARLVLQKGWPEASVSTAQGGEQALALLEVQPFDVVLMDMVMPEMDGLEATRRLRQHAQPQVARTIVIGLTAKSSAREREQCLHAGMDEVLAKPIELAALTEALARLTPTRRH